MQYNAFIWNFFNVNNKNENEKIELQQKATATVVVVLVRMVVENVEGELNNTKTYYNNIWKWAAAPQQQQQKVACKSKQD